jgi:hypothetical protein
VPLPNFDILRDGLPMNVPQIVGHQHGQLLAQQLILYVTEYSFRCAVRKQDLAVFIDHDDRIRGRLGDCSKQCFWLPQDSVSTLAFRHLG